MLRQGSLDFRHVQSDELYGLATSGAVLAAPKIICRATHIENLFYVFPVA